MGTKGIWSYNDVHGIERPNLPQKLSLVSPKMDIEVTGVPPKNVRTHLIDHPKDEGQKQRQQLWNFQQRYRGAIGKLRNLPIQKSDAKANEEDEDTTDDDCETKQSHSGKSKISLQSRHRRRFGKPGHLSSKHQDLNVDGVSAKSRKPDETMDKDGGKRPSIQRLYSSGFIVKNSLYQQLKGDDITFKKRPSLTDDPGLLETSSRFGGSLERFPDITRTYQQLPTASRFRKMSISHYSRRYGESVHERRVLTLRRSLTSVTEMDSSRRRLLLVSKRDNNIDGLGCIGSEDDDDDDEFEVTGEPAKSNKKAMDNFLSISSNSAEEDRGKGNTNYPTRTENGTSARKHVKKEVSVSDIKQQSPRDTVVEEKNKNNNNNTNSNKSLTGYPNGDRVEVYSGDIKKAKKHSSFSKQDDSSESLKGTRQISLEPPEIIRTVSSASLDIPSDRFGPTTHSIDKKLALRKPWEWRPNPYRWTEKNVRESDKPYIEKILNKGEIIDEFNYDSFARTKPPKLANITEQTTKGVQR